MINANIDRETAMTIAITHGIMPSMAKARTTPIGPPKIRSTVHSHSELLLIFVLQDGQE